MKTPSIRTIKSHLNKMDSESFKNYLIDKGFIKLGEGVSRESFGDPNGKICIKLELWGDDKNQEEYDNYKKFQKHPILKYLTVPIYGCFYNSNDGYSILISAHAKPVEISNKNCDNYPAKNRKSKQGFVVKDKKMHKMANVFYSCFQDAHDENIMKFGNSLVLIDLDNENYRHSSQQMHHLSKKVNKILDFEDHAVEWHKQKAKAFKA